MATVQTEVNNGVNVAALLGAREALTATPEGAKFKWRASHTWVNGTHSRSVVSRSARDTVSTWSRSRPAAHQPPPAETASSNTTAAARAATPGRRRAQRSSSSTGP